MDIRRKRKMYYNLTRIQNGWILSYPFYSSHKSRMSFNVVERCFDGFSEAMKFIEAHYDELVMNNETYEMD